MSRTNQAGKGDARRDNFKKFQESSYWENKEKAEEKCSTCKGTGAVLYHGKYGSWEAPCPDCT